MLTFDHWKDGSVHTEIIIEPGHTTLHLSLNAKEAKEPPTIVPSMLTEPIFAQFPIRRSWRDIQETCRSDTFWRLWERLHPIEIATLRSHIVRFLLPQEEQRQKDILKQIETVHPLPWSEAEFECSGKKKDCSCENMMDALKSGNDEILGLRHDCKLTCVRIGISAGIRKSLTLYRMRSELPLSTEDWEMKLHALQHDIYYHAQFWIEKSLISQDLTYLTLEFAFGPRLPRLPRKRKQ
jgi:hypothetical protein